MRSAVTAVTSVLLAMTFGAALSGCQRIPKSASVKDFCSAGEKFSASTTFKQGVSGAKRLEKVGTPKNIPPKARDGFVQLVNRVLDAKDGKDFIKRSNKLDAGERKSLMALNDYIKTTCKT